MSDETKGEKMYALMVDATTAAVCAASESLAHVSVTFSNGAQYDRSVALLADRLMEKHS